MSKHLLLAVQFIVNNAMASKLELGVGKLDAHVGAAYDDYLTRYSNKFNEGEIEAIYEQLIFGLGFRW